MLLRLVRRVRYPEICLRECVSSETPCRCCQATGSLCSFSASTFCTVISRCSSAGAAKADRALVRANADTIASLRASTIEEDLEQLASEPALPHKQKLALQFRIALKKAALLEGLL